MAGIDKIYTDSYKEYVEFKEWSKNQKVEYFNGIVDSPYEYMYYNWSEESFKKHKNSPIMNTSTSIDIFLIQNCPFGFVQERMKVAYGDEYENMKNNINYTLKPENYRQNRKFKIIKNGELPLYNKGIKSHGWFWLQARGENDMWFNSEYNLWVNENLPYHTNTSHHKTIKSLIRFLRKQYLPSGIEFILQGGYVGESFIIKIL